MAGVGGKGRVEVMTFPEMGNVEQRGGEGNAGGERTNAMEVDWGKALRVAKVQALAASKTCDD